MQDTLPSALCPLPSAVVLFAGNMGRTEFPGDDHDTLIRSITQRLWPMGDSTVLMPGHGPESSIGQARALKPCVGGI